MQTARPALAEPLWPGARYTEEQRKRAVRRGLEYLYRVALNRRHFEDYCDDLLWCFFCVSRNAADAQLKQRALTMGRERARHWRRLNPRVETTAAAADISSYAYASLSADGFGFRDERMKADIARAASRFGPADFLKFDPLTELPPADVPKQCENCQSENRRGAKTCRTCRRPLSMHDPYDLLCDALVVTFVGDSYGVTLGCHLSEVMRLVPRMRPYPQPDSLDYERLASVVYAITHVIYALNDYNLFRLNPAWLPQEFDYLKSNLQRAIDNDDAEIAGEFLDTLQSFGLTTADAVIRSGIDFVLSQQNADGSWGDAGTGDIYDLYHATWTAVCGLTDYEWRGEGVAFPEALRQVGGA